MKLDLEEIDIEEMYEEMACHIMHNFKYERDYMTINFIERSKYDQHFKCQNCQESIPFYQKIYGFWHHKFCSEECRDFWKNIEGDGEKKSFCIRCDRLKKCMASPDWDPDAKITSE